MSLKQRFVILTLLYAVLVGYFVVFLEGQRGQVHRVRQGIEADWREVRTLFETQALLGRLKSSLEAPDAARPEDVEMLLRDYDRAIYQLMEYAEQDLPGRADTPLEQGAVARLRDNAARWRALAERLHDPDSAPNDIARESAALFQQGSDAVMAFSRGAWHELDGSLGALGDSERRIEAITRTWTLGMIGLLAIGWLGFALWVMRPIRRLRHMVRTLRQRRFEDLAGDDDAHGEIGELMDSFANMSGEIQAFTEDLEGRVRQRTTELEASREQLRQMLDRLPDAVGLVLPDNSILMANATYRALVGEAGKSRLQEILAAPRTPQGYRAWTDDRGATRYLDVQTYLLTPRLEEPHRDVMLEYVRDMTRQYEVESALATSQKLAAIGRLSSGIAHEINNPLTAIGACAEGLLKRLRSDRLETETFAEYLKTIQEEVFRCKEITEKLLDYSRQREEAMALCQVGTIVDDIIRLAEPIAAKKGLRIAWRFDGNDEVFSNCRAIKQVLLNLVLNAIEACDQGGRIDILLAGRREDVAVEVRDNGVGFEPEEATRLFDAFYTRRRDGTGTGLGLFVCLGLTQALGGTLAANSAGPGAGACFTLTLPRRRGAASPAADIPSEAAAHD